MSATMRPSVRVDRSLSERAIPDGGWRGSRAAATTRARVSGRAAPTPASTRLTVAVETPARLATWRMVVAIAPSLRWSAAAGSADRRLPVARGSCSGQLLVGCRRVAGVIGGHRRSLDRARVRAHELVELAGKLGQLAPAAHQPEQLVLADLAAQELACESAVGEDREPVRDGQGVLHVVGDEDDREALRPGADHVAKDDRSLLHPERRRWLVEDQDA